MKNRPILITGCQRSGTTLLQQILDSHPDIHAIDEDRFHNARLLDYLNSPDYHPLVAFKLPMFAPAIDSFRQLPELRILWCLRDPRDVVLSMLRQSTGKTVSGDDVGELLSWSQIRGGAELEIRQTLPALDSTSLQALQSWLPNFKAYCNTPPSQRQRAAALDTAALCWMAKNALLGVYRTRGVDHHVVSYERLVADPEATLRKCLAYLGDGNGPLCWHPNLLQHPTLHQGKSVSDTENTRRIGASSSDEWRTGLSPDEAVRVEEITAALATSLGYPRERW